MSSIDQYIQLYDSQKALICNNAPEAMNRWRHDARAMLEGATLPDEHTDGYERTSIERLMQPDLGININRLNFQADVASSFRCDIPNMSTLLAVVVNDVFHPTTTLSKNLPEGVIFDSISNVAASHPELIEKYYGSVAPLDAPPVALNTLLAQDGVMVYVPKNTILPRPLQLVNIFSSPTPLLAMRRLLVVLEDGAQAQLLICDHTQGQNGQYIASVVTEVVTGRRARFDLYDMEKSSANTSRHSMTFARQLDDSNLLINTTTLTCGTTRNEVTVNIDGQHCDTLLSGMAIATESMHIDNATAVNHRAPRSTSNQLYKYVLEDTSRGAFEGRITVTPEAPFTAAYQTNRNIVASQTAHMHTNPTLLIYNDEVKCSHGATTGQLDNDALFYMRTRGIPLAEARNMLMQAFMVDVIDSVRLESLRDRLRHLVEKRFNGEEHNCEICNSKSL